MRISEFTFLLVKSLNPGDYKMLVTRKKRETMKYFFMLLLFSIIIGFIFSIPKLMAVPSKIDTVFMKFERFNITGIDIEANEPIVLLKYPKTVLDLTENRNNISSEMILITKSDIIWKKFSPSLFQWRLFLTEQKPISEYSDILHNAGRIKGGAYWLLLILLLPSIFLIVLLLNFIKYTLIISIATFIGLLIVKLKGKKAKLFTIWRVAIFSSSIMIMIEIGLSPLFNFSIYFSIFPILLYFLMFYLAMLVISEKEINFKKSEE